MFNLTKPVSTLDVAEKFSLKFIGPEISIHGVGGLDSATGNGLLFSNKEPPISLRNNVIVSRVAYNEENTFLITENPRLTFAKIVQWLVNEIGIDFALTVTDIHPSVRLGSNCFIGEGVKIGEGTIIGNNVTINSGVCIGKFCNIKSNTVIGEDGFGYERDENGIPIKFPHLGSVVIGDYVDIGSLNTIVRGALGNTIIGSNTKTDDHVHIAHNCIIEENVLITACVELSGGVNLGKNSWIGPNSSLMQKVRVGSNSLVGIGTLVLKDVEENVVVAGVPAKVLPKKSN
jgi:UDP-3-O-[3-hydroxymyristoyl] glucosamine N-acyltransferase